MNKLVQSDRKQLDHTDWVARGELLEMDSVTVTVSGLETALEVLAYLSIKTF